MKNPICTAALWFVLCLSCEEGLLPDIDRVSEDPGIVEPRTENFQRELCVEIAWDDDPAADEYILRRALDNPVPGYRILYRGTGTGFTDTGLAHEQRYLYTLAKRKGNREFGPSSPSLGVGHDSIGDGWEPNDSKLLATRLAFQINANTYFYQDYNGDRIEDTDWYCLEVPARHMAQVQIDQIRPDVGGENTFLYFQQEGQSRIMFADKDPIEICNYSMETALFRFRITPIPAKCINELEVAGGTLIEYTVTIANIRLL